MSRAVAFPSNRSSAGSSVFSGAGLELSGTLDSSMPSAMLEQEAQTFGLRDREFPFSGMGSPQQTQIREFTS